MYMYNKSKNVYKIKWSRFGLKTANQTTMKA